VNKSFLKLLLEKSPTYLHAWAFFYANADDNGTFIGNTVLLQSKFKVSRSSLQRIIDYGVAWAAVGQQLGRSWADNELKITNLHGALGQQLGSSWAEVGQLTEKKPPKKKPIEKPESDSKETIIEPKKQRRSSDKLYPKMVDVYNSFCERQVGMGAKMNAHQGKAMKSIIEYLKSQVINKIGAEEIDQVEEQIIIAWEYILSNWGMVNGYYQDQIKLSQIDSNMPVILMQLRQNKKNKRDEQYANTANEIGRTNFE